MQASQAEGAGPVARVLILSLPLLPKEWSVDHWKPAARAASPAPTPALLNQTSLSGDLHVHTKLPSTGLRHIQEETMETSKGALVFRVTEIPSTLKGKGLMML